MTPPPSFTPKHDRRPPFAPTFAFAALGLLMLCGGFYRLMFEGGISPRTVEASVINNDQMVADELIKLGQHGDPHVRISVAKALPVLPEAGTPERIAALILLLNDPDYLVRGFAAKSLYRMGSPEAKRALHLRLATEENDVVRSLLQRLAK